MVCLLFEYCGMPAASAIAYRLISTGSILLWAALFSWTAVQARSLVGLARGYLLLLLAIFLTVPWFQPWYVLWIGPFLIIEPDARWRRFIAQFMIVTVVQWAAPLDPFTTVIGNIWAASRMWSLVQDVRERSVAADPEANQMPEAL